MILSIIPVVTSFFFFLIRIEGFAYLSSWPVTIRILQAGKRANNELIWKNNSKCHIFHLLPHIPALPSAENK